MEQKQSWIGYLLQPFTCSHYHIAEKFGAASGSHVRSIEILIFGFLVLTVFNSFNLGCILASGDGKPDSSISLSQRTSFYAYISQNDQTQYCGGNDGEDVMLSVGLLDALGILFFYCWLKFYRFKTMPELEQKYDREALTIGDYTLWFKFEKSMPYTEGKGNLTPEDLLKLDIETYLKQMIMLKRKQKSVSARAISLGEHLAAPSAANESEYSDNPMYELPHTSPKIVDENETVFIDKVTLTPKASPALLNLKKKFEYQQLTWGLLQANKWNPKMEAHTFGHGFYDFLNVLQKGFLWNFLVSANTQLQVMHQKIKDIDHENFEINSETGKFKRNFFHRTATSKYTSAFVTFRYEADYELVRDENPKP
mmetsp:Transcript_2601/g.4352  ORF Transcript_2601/g.4352 Transcript_2601/m.4352 type:complete len:367 (-) Transcript_2601:2-1102(-)